MLAAPVFHHLHLNSVDPDAAIGFYIRRFPSSRKTSWQGRPALAAPNDVLILFDRVATRPPTSPPSAIWHFGWHVPDSRATLAAFQDHAAAGHGDVELLPLHTGDGEGAVWVSSDTWPGAGGVLGRTKAQIAEAQATGVEPTRSGGFGYLRGPDGALVEYAGNHPAERFKHVHLFHEDPLCAQLWYRRHLDATVVPGRAPQPPVTDADCRVPRGADRTFPALDRDGMFRTPSAAVAFGDVTLPSYMRQGDRPLVSSRGQLYDHIGLGARDLDAWIVKLRSEGVGLLDDVHPLGDTRAVMIEGPSREAIELVEVG